jgi:hypothetical protein
MLSIKKNIEIKQVEIDENNFIVTSEEDLENSKINITTNSNPLFVNPIQNGNSQEKKKIRV